MKDLMHTIIRSELHFKGNIEIKCHCSTFMLLTYCTKHLGVLVWLNIRAKYNNASCTLS